MVGFQQTAQFGYDPSGEEGKLIVGRLFWDPAFMDKIALRDMCLQAYHILFPNPVDHIWVGIFGLLEGKILYSNSTTGGMCHNEHIFQRQ